MGLLCDTTFYQVTVAINKAIKHSQVRKQMYSYQQRSINFFNGGHVITVLEGSWFDSIMSVFSEA